MSTSSESRSGLAAGSASPEPQDLLVKLRRQLHAHPELSGKEAGTTACLREFLVTCNPQRLLDRLGGHGLAAIFTAPDQAEGPTIVLRAELDALPVAELGDRPHASRRAGISHACGHDGHLAMLCGLARGLRSDPLKRGRLVLLCQPSEETGQGARAVLDDPRWQQLAIDQVFALHNLPGHPLGSVMLRAGPVTAGSVGLVIRLIGRTAHAAYPEDGLSPALAMSRLVPRLVSLPIDLEDRGHLALVTIVHARLGVIAFGTTPGEAEIMATLRSDDEMVLEELKSRAVVSARDEASADGLDCEITWVEEFPVTINHPRSVVRARRAARTAGLAIARPPESPFRWSEDFGWFMRRTPGSLVGLGAGEDQPVLHAPDYDFPDALLPIGVRFYEALLVELGLR